MGKVVLHISMSLDGFITEPNEGVGNPLGDDPGRLHDWMFDAKTETDAAVLDEIHASTGAVLIGKRMFDVGVEPWGDPPPFGMPVFVVTHEEREPLHNLLHLVGQRPPLGLARGVEVTGRLGEGEQLGPDALVQPRRGASRRPACSRP